MSFDHTPRWSDIIPTDKQAQALTACAKLQRLCDIPVAKTIVARLVQRGWLVRVQPQEEATRARKTSRRWGRYLITQLGKQALQRYNEALRHA